MFKPVSDQALAQIVSHVEQEKMHMERLSAMSASVSEQLVDCDDSSTQQPVSVDTPSPVIVTLADVHQPLEGPGLCLFH